MNHLSHEEQELVLDFYFRCGCQEDIDNGRDLIASKAGAAKLYAKLEDTLTDLDSIKYESCPDNLVDLTIARLKLASSVKIQNMPSRLHELLEKEQETTLPVSSKEPLTKSQKPQATGNIKLHHRLGEMMATAAAIVLIFSILFPTAGAMRQHSRQATCTNNFKNIGQAFSTFANDHQDKIAESRVQAGAPWWKIGYQGSDSHSNTRYPWQLVKQGYVKGKVFVCRGNIGASPVKYDPVKMGDLVDFPSRNNISYSFMLFCDKTADTMQGRRKIIASDLNPVFRNIPSEQNDYERLNEFEKILLNKQLKEMLSSSHGSKGQNVLHCDGSVEWIKVRVVNDDDIYTIRGVDTYTGKEMPTEPDDIFLVP
ncbi:MAG: hypothetical protein H8E62_08095 [Planctomycetes bacterium]|nr:hypothetical protein [Planctomycetota bacterium]